MSDFFHGWKRRVGLITVLVGVVVIGRWMQIDARYDSRVGEPKKLILQTNPGVEIVQASHEAPRAATSVPKISIRVCLVESTVSSPDVQTILDKYATCFDSALAEFNASSTLCSGDFIGSEQLAALIKDFESKGTITIREEIPRLISNGTTDNWGNAISVSATPRIETGDNVVVSISAVAKGLKTQTTLCVPARQTLIFAGSQSSAVESKIYRIPLLGDLPAVGEWFAFHFTQTKGHQQVFLLSAAILPGSNVRGQPE